MNRFQDKREKIMRIESNIYAKVLKRLHKENMTCSGWLASWVGRHSLKLKMVCKVSLLTWP